jgi:hypothetical protein
LKSSVIHFLLIFIFFVITLRDFLVVEGGNFPRKTNFGFLVLLGGVDDRGVCTNGLVSCADISIATFVIRVFNVLADVFPGEESPETRDFSLIVTNEED